MRESIGDKVRAPLAAGVSLYIHLPFCRKKCDYCDFFSKERAKSGDKEEVIEKIIADTREMLSLLDPPSIETVYIGGGTPNSLSRKHFSRLLRGLGECVYSRSSKIKEWTVEINPEFLDTRQLEELNKAGVDRLSIGVQSFRDDSLRLIGRNAGIDETVGALELLSAQWKDRWTMDLISLIPGSESDPLSDLKKAMTYKARHISLYGLTIEAGTPLQKRLAAGKIKRSGEEEAGDILKAQWDFLRDQGFTHYEVSNFAAGRQDEGIHNLRYWHLEPYLGIGPSAVSTIPGREGPLRIQELEKRGEYRIEYITPYSFLLEHLMTSLRTREGLSYVHISKRFGTGFANGLKRALKMKLRRYEKIGFVEKNGRGFSFTDEGMMILDSLLLDLAGDLDGLAIERVNWPQQRREFAQS
jgi:oxygen-independent coproporphyrinogen III oxidase